MTGFTHQVLTLPCPSLLVPMPHSSWPRGRAAQQSPSVSTSQAFRVSLHQNAARFCQVGDCGAGVTLGMTVGWAQAEHDVLMLG